MRVMAAVKKRSDRTSGGMALAFMSLLVDVLATAPGEHLRRNRTVAHSLAPRPSLTTRAFGLAGVGAGLAILAAFVVSLPEAWFFWRIVVFAIGVIAIGIGIHLRQSPRARSISLGVTGALIVANVAYLITIVVFPPGHVAGFWAGLVLWLAGAAFGLAAALIGELSRIGGWAVAVGSLLTLTGIDRLGLVSQANPTVFNTLSQVGIMTMAAGWIVLGLDVALRRSDRPEAV